MPTSLKKIFITGAGGMLGTDLVKSLQGSFELLGSGLTPAPHLSIPYQQADLSDFEAAAKIVNHFKPQLIFHCAAFTDVDAYEIRPRELLRQNSLLIESIVKAANQSGALLIFFSTDYVFDGTKKGEYTETDPVCPINTYGKSKADAEKYIQGHSSRYAIFRISWLYGNHGKSFPRTIWEKAETQQNFKVVSDQVGRPTFTWDVADAFKHLLIENPEPLEKINRQIFHLTNDGICSWAELAEFILTMRGSKPFAVEKISSTELTRAARRPNNSVLALEKSEKVLGLRLRSWKPAVTEFLLEFKKEPAL